MLKVGLFTKLTQNKLLYTTKTYNNVQKSVDKYSSVFGKAAGDYLLTEVGKLQSGKKTLSIKQKNTSLDLLNSILYPLNGLPIDLLESVLLKLKKIKPNSKRINSILNSNLVKNRQKARSVTSKHSAVSNCLDSMSLHENEIFREGQNRLNPVISNYSSDKERAVNRLASGLVPAVFFANDAYNQSMIINNNKEEAKAEKRQRFKQEAARIGIMAYTQFVVLGALSRYVNKSPLVSILTTTGIVAGTEMLSRVFTGKPVTFLKQKQNNDEEHPIIDIANDDSTKKHSSKLLSFTAALFTAGAAATVFKNSKSGQKILPQIAKRYDKLIRKDVFISKKEFDSAIKKLNDTGFDKLAQKYEQIASKQKGDNIHLGKENRKILNPLIDSVIMTPVRALYNISTMPFKMFSKKKNVKNPPLHDGLQGITYIKTIQNRNDFKNKLNEKILSSFDTKTKTRYSNHNLAKYSKITTSSVSSYFIVADSYNMVMKKENNKDNAKKVSKNVMLQRGVNIGLGAYILTVLNNVFKMRYNKSLFGVALVAGMFGLMNESISRLATGIPITEKTREEQIKFKQRYNKFLNKTAA